MQNLNNRASGADATLVAFFEREREKLAAAHAAAQKPPAQISKDQNAYRLGDAAMRKGDRNEKDFF